MKHHTKAIYIHGQFNQITNKKPDSVSLFHMKHIFFVFSNNRLITPCPS